MVANDKTLALTFRRALLFGMRWTEKQMEDWLKPQSRRLFETGGKPIQLEQSKLFWEYFDYLVGNKLFTERQLVQAGDKVTEVYGLPFPLAIQDAVAHLYNEWHDG